MYKENILNKLDKALMQVHMLERIEQRHVQATALQVSDTIKRLRQSVEEARRLIELSK